MFASCMCNATVHTSDSAGVGEGLRVRFNWPPGRCSFCTKTNPSPAGPLAPQAPGTEVEQTKAASAVLWSSARDRGRNNCSKFIESKVICQYKVVNQAHLKRWQKPSITLAEEKGLELLWKSLVVVLKKRKKTFNSSPLRQ